MKKVLFIDDENNVFNIIRRFLNKKIIVDYAPDSKKGLDLFIKNQYDLIITDYNMQPFNGLELIQKVREVIAKKS